MSGKAAWELAVRIALSGLMAACCGCGSLSSETAAESAADEGAQPAAREADATPPPPVRPVVSPEKEKQVGDVLKDMYENQRRGMMNVSTDDGKFLRLITEAMGAKHIVEIGTSNGYSATWFCLGLKATGGRLTTFEIDARRAALARENFKRAGVDDIVTLVEGDAHKEVTKLEGPIDIVFLDADKGGYIDYLNKLLPLVRRGGLIMAHNTKSHGGAMKEYLDAVTTNEDLETIFVLKDRAGIGVTLKKR